MMPFLKNPPCNLSLPKPSSVILLCAFFLAVGCAPKLPEPLFFEVGNDGPAYPDINTVPFQDAPASATTETSHTDGNSPKSLDEKHLEAKAKALRLEGDALWEKAFNASRPHAAEQERRAKRAHKQEQARR